MVWVLHEKDNNLIGWIIVEIEEIIELVKITIKSIRTPAKQMNFIFN